MLEINNISFRYNPDKWIFNQINFVLKPGEIIGLYGESGTGKSTFAKVIAGHLKPDKGKVTVNGVPYNQKGRNPVQIIGQHPEKAINPRWKMKQVLAESGGFDEALLEMFGINQELLQRYPSQLSGGELQRFCLARTMAPETKFLIADEMTTMLDTINKAQIWKTVLQIVKQRQLGMLVVSHELPLLNRICTSLLSFEDMLKTNQEKKNHGFNI
ncbi:ABC transporter ATP-binding protein [Gelatiniphilus marinus]|uniref:ABC transporter ATP-binding protein n=1 Tax=Gelatiniphilus marinus TaxID=1759464 RepID=A0ABW5JNS0_9FLAO